MTWIHRTARAAIAAVLVSITAACSGGDEGGPAATPGSILVAASPTTLSVDQGTGGASTITLTRVAGFSGSVILSLSGLPVGATATITPSELSGSTTTATMTIAVAAAVPAGTYIVTISGSATGIPVATATLALNVTARPVGSTDVVYEYCRELSAPIFVAYQDGNAAWQMVTPTLVGGSTRIAFKLDQAYGGVIAVYPSEALSLSSSRSAGGRSTRNVIRTLGSTRNRGEVLSRGSRTSARSNLESTFSTVIRYASARELAEDAAETCRQTAWTKRVTGVVNGVGAGQYGVLSLGPSTEVFVGGTSKNPVTFSDVPNGALDFVAARLTAPGQPPDRLVVLRNLDIPDGGSLPATIHFNGQSSAPSTANATIQGGSNDNLEIFSEVVTARGGRSLLWFDLSPSVTINRRWAGLAPTTMIAGDFHSVVVFATPSIEGDYRVALEYVGQVTDQLLTLGPKIDAPVTSVVASGAYPRLRFQGDLPVEYNKGVEIVLGDEEAGNMFSIAATGAYLAAAGDVRRYNLLMPDVRGLESFPEASRLAVGPNDVSLDVFGFTGPGVFDLTANLGSEYKAAIKVSTVVVP